MLLHTQCPYCGEPHNYRYSSIGNLTRCVTCGNRYRLPRVAQNLKKSGYGACLGCAGLLALGGCLFGLVGMGLHRVAHEATQETFLKEQETRLPEQRRTPEREEQERRALLEQQRTQEEARRKAKEEAAREVARKAELEEKGLPYYPRPLTLYGERNAQEWYQLLLDRWNDARLVPQATEALVALKEEGIPSLLDYLSRQTTSKDRNIALRLIRVEYVHPNDLHRLLPCLEQRNATSSTRMMALSYLKKRAKDLKKTFVPEIEILVEDMLTNSRFKEETKEEIRSMLKTIRAEAK